MKAIIAISVIAWLTGCETRTEADQSIESDTMQTTISLVDDLDTLRESVKALEGQVTDNSLYTSLPGNADDSYQKIHIAFTGMPEIEVVKPLMEGTMNKYKVVINNQNVMKVANMLVALRNQSAVGVTEMDILKHMYQKGSSELKIQVQAATSATILEENK